MTTSPGRSEVEDEERARRAANVAETLDLEPHEGHLRILWQDLAETRIEDGVDWPYIAQTLFRDIDRLAERFGRIEQAAEARGIRIAADLVRDHVLGATGVGIGAFLDERAARADRLEGR